YLIDQDLGVNNGQFRVVDTATNTVISTLTIGTQVVNIALNPSGTRAYLIDTAGTLRVIDTSSVAVVATASTGLSPRQPAVSPDGAYVYTANVNSGTISIFSTATNTLVGTASNVGFTIGGIVISADGTKLYLGNGGTDDSVRTFTRDTATGLLTEIANA